MTARTTRSQAAKHGKPDEPLLQVLPATQAYTISNASSLLLRLPQEVKNDIYQLVLGGNYIHVVDHCNAVCPYKLYCCQALETDTAAQRNFESTSSPPALSLDPHRNCNSCDWGWTYPAGSEPTSPDISVGFLQTCREVYAEATEFLYTANTFLFENPELLSRFIRDCENPCGRHVTIRSLQLHMDISRRDDELAWNQALETMSQSLTGLRRIHLSIEQDFWYGNGTSRKLPMMDKKKKKEDTFLAALKELGTLNLSHVTIAVVDNSDKIRDFHESNEFFWSYAQKQEWARMVKKAILTKEAVVG